MDKSELCCSNCKKKINIGDEVYFNLKNFISGKSYEIDDAIYCENCSKIFLPDYSNIVDEHFIYKLKQGKIR